MCLMEKDPALLIVLEASMPNLCILLIYLWFTSNDPVPYLQSVGQYPLCKSKLMCNGLCSSILSKKDWKRFFKSDSLCQEVDPSFYFTQSFHPLVDILRLCLPLTATKLSASFTAWSLPCDSLSHPSRLADCLQHYTEQTLTQQWHWLP